MSAADLIRRCAGAGVRLISSGGALRVDAPPGAVTADLRALLVEHKAELLAALTIAEHRPPPDPLPAMLENIAERAAIIGENATTADDWREAERDAVRLVQCRTCAHFTPDGINAGAAIGTCCVEAWPQSRSGTEWPARTHGAPPWPAAVRYCKQYIMRSAA